MRKRKFVRTKAKRDAKVAVESIRRIMRETGCSWVEAYEYLLNLSKEEYAK